MTRILGRQGVRSRPALPELCGDTARVVRVVPIVRNSGFIPAVWCITLKADLHSFNKHDVADIACVRVALVLTCHCVCESSQYLSVPLCEPRVFHNPTTTCLCPLQSCTRAYGRSVCTLIPVCKLVPTADETNKSGKRSWRVNIGKPNRWRVGSCGCFLQMEISPQAWHTRCLPGHGYRPCQYPIPRCAVSWRSMP